MRWLQYTLFLLARSIEAENGSGFHLSCLDLSLTLVKFAAATDVTLLGVEDALVVGSGTAMEENATGETSESHQVRSVPNVIFIFAPRVCWPT